MIEPEMAFYGRLDMDGPHRAVHQAVVADILEHCKQELETLVATPRFSMRLQLPFPRVHYDDAVRIIRGEQDVNGKNSIQTLGSRSRSTSCEKG